MASSTKISLSRRSSGISTGRILQNAFSVAILIATLAVSFSPHLFSNINISSLITSQLAPQPVVNPVIPNSTQAIRIGIVSGHWGHDFGAVCDDGTTEQQVNLMIATLVQQKLSAYGYEVDLLQEFDPRLDGYKAAVLLSIHNDSCQYINDRGHRFQSSFGSSQAMTRTCPPAWSLASVTVMAALPACHSIPTASPPT